MTVGLTSLHPQQLDLMASFSGSDCTPAPTPWQPSTTPEEDPSELRRLAAKTPADADEDDTHKETRIYSPKEFKTVRSGIPPTQIV
ncbi:hypothetical protein BD777DRAFT_160840 [Yarrowia lipolytica]|nr:hypothetical protein BD777DRAFT_160840 [Yarrowia lipolytica]